jgi:predicted Zn-dependent protease
MCFHCAPDRRGVLGGAAAIAAATPMLAGCDGDGWMINLVPETRVLALSAMTWQQITANVPPSADQNRQSIVRGITDRLLRANGHDPASWQVRLFSSPQVNAFALPGGRIGVFEGMFRVAENRDQLAAVIGHEIGHVTARHGQARMNAEALRRLGVRVVNLALGLSGVPYSHEIAAALGVGTQYGILLPFSRRQELKADELGLFSMARAGFNPEQAPALWRRMERLTPSAGPSFLATHPAAAERVGALEAMVPRARALMGS